MEAQRTDVGTPGCSDAALYLSFWLSAPARAWQIECADGTLRSERFQRCSMHGQACREARWEVITTSLARRLGLVRRQRDKRRRGGFGKAAASHRRVVASTQWRSPLVHTHTHTQGPWDIEGGGGQVGSEVTRFGRIVIIRRDHG